MANYILMSFFYGVAGLKKMVFLALLILFYLHSTPVRQTETLQCLLVQTPVPCL